MLIESFHNLLKTKFFSGKRNCRLDRLIYILTGPLQSHLNRKERVNAFGLNGSSQRQNIGPIFVFKEFAKILGLPICTFRGNRTIAL